MNSTFLSDSWIATDDFDACVRSSCHVSNIADLDEERLADLIEHDGRLRLDRGLDCSLDRYLSAVPDLSSRHVALDAAIDIALRAIQGRAADPNAVERSVLSLSAAYPDLAEQVRLASTLSRQIGRTHTLGTTPQDLNSRIGKRCGPELEGVGPRYELTSLLGAGSNGAVYEALDRLMSGAGHEVKVAIKFLHPHASSNPPHDSNTLDSSPQQSVRRPHARLLDEARRTRRVEHPNILRVLDFGASPEEGAFVVTELVRGESLQDRAQRFAGRMPPRLAASFISHAARGVHAAHLAGVLHCDLKPSNILLGPGDTPHVADFGAGTTLSDSASNEAAPLGNAAFAAPEQFRREQASLSRETDVYALGGMLAYLITAQYPNGSTLSSIRARHTSPSPENSPSHRFPGMDRALNAICQRALLPSPQGRYPSAQALADDLEAWLNKRPVTAWNAPTAVRVAWFLSRNRVPALAATLALLVVGALAYSGLRKDNQIAESEAATKAQAERANNAEAAQATSRDVIRSVFGDLAKLKKSQTHLTPQDALEILKPIGDIPPSGTPNPSENKP